MGLVPHVTDWSYSDRGSQIYEYIYMHILTYINERWAIECILRGVCNRLKFVLNVSRMVDTYETYKSPAEEYFHEEIE